MIKAEVLRFLSELYDNVALPKSIISSFLSLVPKNDNPQSLIQYRLISLVGSFYKTVVKLLVGRI